MTNEDLRQWCLEWAARNRSDLPPHDIIAVANAFYNFIRHGYSNDTQPPVDPRVPKKKP